MEKQSRNETKPFLLRDELSMYKSYSDSFISTTDLAMSSDSYKRTLLTFYMQHEIELDVSFNLIYSFLMIASNVRSNP